MTIKLPTKTPETTPGNPVEPKFKPFQPEMPQIPGVTDGSRHARRGLEAPRSPQLALQIAGSVAIVVLLGAAWFWWIRSKTRVATPSPDAQVAEQAEPAPLPPLPNVMAPVHEGPSVAATVDELSKPWAAKKFTFVNPITQENINSMVIRLPGGGLWAFSLQGPFGRCELEFVTDPAVLASKYRYNASHPMVVNPCDSTVYDPLKVGAVGGDTFVRGLIVQGSSLRPPISIDVKVRGKFIVAQSIE